MLIGAFWQSGTYYMSESTVIAGELASFMCLLASTLLHSRDFKLQIFKKIVRFFLHYVLNVLELWVAFVVTEYSQLLRHVCCHLMFDKSKVKIKILQMSECVICFSEFGIEANRMAYRQVYMLVSCVFNLILLVFQ